MEKSFLNGPRQPLAIVGMACRFPKGLDAPEQLWRALCDRISAIDYVPADRWTVDRYFSSDPTARGKSYIRRGGFIQQDVSQMDAAFFGISPRDAENMDPQQRLLLEVVWEAFENAGLPLPSYAGRNIGVYVGGFMLDHMISQMAPSNRSAINQNTAAGMMMTMLSNRISHTFDFRGPSLSIDTACSSSLVAFHFACQDLWQGNTEMAVVGGANVMLRPEYPMGMCKGQFLSRDGECKSFDSRGDGYGRGEGAGIVLVKPLDAALRNGDTVLSTVIATGTNQDGRTPGISMPNGEAQQALIEQVCQRYGIDPASIEYVECHGTGTAIGDPTECKAIAATYGKARRSAGTKPVIVGSIKSNIGHLEAAAGIAGVIKATMTSLHRVTSPLANLQEINPTLANDDLHIQLSTDALPLTSGDDAPLRIAINSFGYGGSNAHVILQAYDGAGAPESQANEADAASVSAKCSLPWFVPISARSEAARREAARLLAEQFVSQPELDIDDVIYSTAFRRPHLSHRAVIKGGSRDEIVDGLFALSRGDDHDNVVTGTEPYDGVRQPVFVFTGMGPQWWGMGQELYADEPVYRAAVAEADGIFQDIAGFSILQEMLKSQEQSQIQRTELAQPANFMIQIGLLAMLHDAGVNPSAVVGHSVGELGSAYAAGVLSLRDALTVCFHRSRLQATCRGTGSMLAVGLSKQRMLARLERYADRVSIAAVNGPTNITIAGQTDAILEIAAELTREDIFHRQLNVEVPYHSPLMDPILGELRQALAAVATAPPCLPLYSTVTGSLVTGPSYGADYWPENVRQPVEFAQAIAALVEAGHNRFLEIGPHPVLATSLQDTLKIAGRDGRLSYTLRREQPERQTFHRSVMNVYATGADLDWSRHTTSRQHVRLPNYAWQRETYWVENDRAKQDRIAPIVHPILGIQEAPGAPVYRNDFDHEPVLYLREHVVTGTSILPAAAYVEALLELAQIQHGEAAGVVIRDLQIAAPMVLASERGLDCVTAYEPLIRTATIRSLENGRLGSGQVHVVGKINGLEKFELASLDLDSLAEQFPIAHDVAAFYQDLDRIGLNYGPLFQTVKTLRRSADGNQVLAEICVDKQLTHDLQLYCVHPTLLDGCLQSLMALLTDSDRTFLPTGVGEFCLYTDTVPARVWCLSEQRKQTDQHLECDLTLLDEAGTVVAVLRSLRLTAAARRERVDQFGDRVKRQILKYEWSYGETLTEPRRLGHWLIFGEHGALVHDLTYHLESYGAVVAATAAFGEAFAKHDQHYLVRPGCLEDAARMLESIGDLDGIAVLSGLSSATDSSDPTGESSLLNIISLLQAQVARSSDPAPRVYLVTRAAFAVNEEDTAVEPAQAAVNGLARVAFNELEGLRVSSIDLPIEHDQQQVEQLALELICDDDHDEVALRGNFRLTSELADSSILSDDRVELQKLSRERPVWVRALRDDVESMGTARIVAAPACALRECDIALEIEAAVIPPDLLQNPDSDTIAQAVVEVVAKVIAVGTEVFDLAVGDRVCGLAPADLASLMVGPRDGFHLVSLDTSVEAADVVSCLATEFCVERGAELLRVAPGDTALVLATPLGLAIANRLSQMNMNVVVLSDDMESVASETRQRFAVYPATADGIAAALRSETGDAGFAVAVVPLQRWQREHHLNLVASGGMIWDLDPEAGACSLPKNAVAVIRSDFHALLTPRSTVVSTLQRVVDRIVSGVVAPPPYLGLSIADLAWQKLPLTETSAKLVLGYEIGDADLPVVQGDNTWFSHQGTCLITGGFGGFGRKTAEWLAANGVRHLVLTGRTGADNDDRRAFVTSLEEQGVTVVAAACDTANYSQLRELFQMIAERMPPLKGIYHSGAVIMDQPIAELDAETLRKVHRSKALGAWNLHLLSTSLELDHFVLYSSLANLVGNSRQAAYSAANGFLNGLAHFRQLQGLPATSVNWGAISDVGVVAQDEKLEQFLRYTGLRGLASTEGLELLKIGLGRRVTQFGVTMITTWTDWARFETRGSTSPRFASLIAADSQGQDNSTGDALREELAKLDPTDQVELLTSLIAEIVASVLKADAANVSVDCSISQLGVDSLMATEIQSILDLQLGLKVSILELIGDATIRSLATQLLKTLQGGATVTG